MKFAEVRIHARPNSAVALVSLLGLACVIGGCGYSWWTGPLASDRSVAERRAAHHQTFIDVSRLVIRSEAVPEWDALFHPEGSAWRGADGCATVALPSSRTLWLFGDTWLKPDRTPGRAGGTVVRNSIALQTWDARGPQPPEFHWSTHPTSGTVDALLPEGGRGFLWPLGGIYLRDRLFLLTVQVVHTPTEFSLSDEVMLVVENPDEAPVQWRARQFRVPFFGGDGNGYTYFCGSPFLHEGMVYVYGVREDWSEGGRGRSQLVARVPEDDFARADFSAWRFWTGAGWSEDVGAARSLFDGASSEYSVSWLPSVGGYVAVYSSDEVAGAIVGRFSPSPQGPWSEAVRLYQCADENWDPRYSYYAAKAHPELASRGNELIVTYATNGEELEDLVKDERLYWPRFVRVTIQKGDSGR